MGPLVSIDRLQIWAGSSSSSRRIVLSGEGSVNCGTGAIDAYYHLFYKYLPVGCRLVAVEKNKRGQIQTMSPITIMGTVVCDIAGRILGACQSVIFD